MEPNRPFCVALTMKLHVDIHIHGDPAIERGLTRIFEALADLKGIAMATQAEFEAGFARVDAATTAIAAILRDLAGQIGSMTSAQEDAARDRLNAVASTLEAMAVTPTNPVPTPVP